MGEEWINWSGSLKFKPQRIEQPKDEKELAALVKSLSGKKDTLRVVGSGHSSTPILQTESILVSLKNMENNEINKTDNVAWVPAQMVLHQAGEALVKIGLALTNLGDVDVQTLAGAISVGTHGTGKTLRNLSGMLTGVRLIDGCGEVREISEEDDPDFIRAARVSLGTLGIFVRLKLNLLPAFQLRRQEWCTHVDDCLAHLDELIENNHNFDFYWYPRSDLVKLRTWNPPGEGMDNVPYAKEVEYACGWSYEILSKKRELKFDEMEYFLPAGAGRNCFEEIRRLIKEHHRKYVGWRVLYRTVAPDDAYLSGAYARQTVTISLHQNASLPFWEYFKDIEPVFRRYGGRPHWAKKHTLKAPDLRRLYPMWNKFLEIRRGMDPNGLFLSPYLHELLGVD